MRIKIDKQYFSFDVLGLYTNSMGENYRSILEIKLNGTSISQPDLMVVMMNPGGSYPLDGYYSGNLKKAHADSTQNRIARFMVENNFRFARVLNLSDYCEKESGKFSSWLRRQSKDSIHSIFSIQRREELNNNFIVDVPVLVAWGAIENTIEIKKEALKYFADKKVKFFGFKMGENGLNYYHPLAPNKYLVREQIVNDEIGSGKRIWLRIVSNAFKNLNKKRKAS